MFTHRFLKRNSYASLSNGLSRQKTYVVGMPLAAIFRGLLQRESARVVGYGAIAVVGQNGKSGKRIKIIAKFQV